MYILLDTLYVWYIKNVKKVYMDYGATTPIDETVLRAMLPYLSEDFGNASSLHTWGRDASKAVERARAQVAKLIGAKAEEIYFTSGATEANKLVLSIPCKVKVASRIEHPSILSSGVELELLEVDEFGRIRLELLEAELKRGADFVSVGLVNSEIGTVQDIEAIGKLCRKHGAILHTDATQGVGKMKIDVDAMGVDALTMSGHKIFGPKGVGVLFVSNRLKWKPPGGGTFNVPAIVGMGAATQLEVDVEYIRELRDYLIERIQAEIPHAYLNGHPKHRVCNNVNISFKAVEGEAILISLDQVGVAVSTGSACASGSTEPSYVLAALGVQNAGANSIRFTLSHHNTKDEIDYVVSNLKPIIEKLRAMSPLGV